MQAQNKTMPTGESVSAFISGVSNAKRREDAEGLLELFGRCTGFEAVMWGPSIVGFSPRASNRALYGLINTAEERKRCTTFGR